MRARARRSGRTVWDMALRDKLRAAVQPHLQPGEQLQVVFAAQNTSQWMMLAGIIPFYFVNQYRVVAVTDRRIVVFDSGKLSVAKAKSVAYELPRATVLGPSKGMLWHRIETGHETLRVHTRFFKDIAQADAAIATPGAPG